MKVLQNILSNSALLNVITMFPIEIIFWYYYLKRRQKKDPNTSDRKIYLFLIFLIILNILMIVTSIY